MGMECTVEGCQSPARGKGLCSSHYQLMRKYGRTTRLRELNKGKKCAADGCSDKAASRGFCKTHYHKHITEGVDRKGRSGPFLRLHPLYNIWWERKKAGVLCDEWLEFSNFLVGVGERPDDNCILVRVTEGKYGPDNFKWMERLKRKPGESKKEWWARKWAARQLVNPGMERERTYTRRYGITTEQYEEMAASQNFLCAICQLPETATEPKTGGLKRLSVDHCHTSNKIRGLLCWRCNGTIGKIDENPALLDAMKEYLAFYK